MHVHVHTTPLRKITEVRKAYRKVVYRFRMFSTYLYEEYKTQLFSDAPKQGPDIAQFVDALPSRCEVCVRSPVPHKPSVVPQL